MKLEDITTDLLSNDNFKAGTGVLGIALGTAILRRGLQGLQTLVRRNFTMTLEVPSHDKSYNWVSSWVSRQTRTTHVSIETHFNRNESGKIDTNYNFVPSPGVHYFIYKNRIICAERARTQPTNVMQSNAMPFESLTLTSFGRDRLLFNSILENAKREALLAEEGWTVIYKAVGPEWRQFGYPRARRPLESVVLDQGLSDRLLNDVNEFLDNQKWYRDRGIPYRRGYLLHGPPGCGKSSFVGALAGALQYSVCLVSLSELGMTGDRLDHLLNHAPLHSVLLLEDIDAAFSAADRMKDNPAYQGMPALTLSGLLNALDGVGSTEGRILFMTTNYPERLDAALVRPGRVDVQAQLGLCSRRQLFLMFCRFYQQEPKLDELANRFADLIGSNKVSPAQVQGFLLCHKSSAAEAIDKVADLVDCTKMGTVVTGNV